MKLKLSLLALTVAATAVLAGIGIRSADAGVTKVMVIHVTDEDIASATPGFVYPEPGIYAVIATGKIIEVAENAAEVLVSKDDLLVSEVFADSDAVPAKGDVVQVSYTRELFADGSSQNNDDYYIISIN